MGVKWRPLCQLLATLSLPWIELVDDALEPDHGEKSGAEPGQAGQEEDAKRE